MPRTERLYRIEGRFSTDEIRRRIWTSAEIWHAEQRSHYDEEGRYILEIPYSDDIELLMDILKYGLQVEGLA